MSAAENNEVKPRRKRRRFTVKYKLEVLRKVEECESGEIGAYLRSEGLYYATVDNWRKQYEEGALQSLADNKRGRKKKENPELEKQIKQLQKEKQKLQKKLDQAELIIEFQKKIADLLQKDE